MEGELFLFRAHPYLNVHKSESHTHWEAVSETALMRNPNEDFFWIMQFLTKSFFFWSWQKCLVSLLLLIGFGIDFSAEAQCVRIRDRRRNNAWTFQPKKDFRCLAAGQSPVTPFTITFESPVSNVTINFGDTVAFYAGPITTATRIYKTTGIFNYTITIAGCSQQIRGIFVNDYNTSCPGVGWIAPPNDSARCLPDSVRLRNLSPGMNGFTEWIINWGDQSRDTADYPSYDKFFSHRYRAGTKLCNATISISYRNSCNIIPCGQAIGATFGPYRFMERDSALLDYKTLFICAPTEVQLKDVSKLNCKDTTNRQVSWTALDGFNQPLPNPGNGIWRPRGPMGNQRITIPASMFSVVPPDSTFKLRLRLRNKCGEDTAEMQVIMIGASTPAFNILNGGSCVGTPIQFENNTSNPYGVVDYQWDFGDGTIETNNSPNPTHVYLNGGNYTVKLRAITKGFGTQTCFKETTLPLFIKPAVLPRIKVTPSNSGCGSLTAIVKNASLNPANATWKGWELGGSPLVTAGTNHFPGPTSSDPTQVQIVNTNPADSSAIIQFAEHGLYALKLTAQSQGCAEYFGTDTVRVYPEPVLRWRLSSTTICQGQPFEVRDSSRIMETTERGLGSDFNHLTWTLKVGNDTTITSSSPLITNFDSPSQSGRISNVLFKNPGTYWIKLTVTGVAGCSKTDSIQVVVRPSAQPKFSIQSVNCDNSNLILKNNTVESANRFVYRIYKGNGIVVGQEYAIYSRTDAQDQSIFLPYTPPGDTTFYYVVLSAVTILGSDSCVIQSQPQLIKVAPMPIPGLQISPALDGCSPMTNVTILNTSLNIPGGGGVVYNWNLGSVGTFQGQNPPNVTFVNTGLVNKRDTVRLCIQTPNGCSYCTEKVVVTYPAPQAQINIPDSICSGQSIQMASTTVGVVSYMWEFNDYDGTTSFQATFPKVFNNLSGIPRIFNISLVVRSQSDCPLRISKPLKVNPNPDFAFQVSTSQDANCGPLRARFHYISPINSSTFHWDFGNGDTLLTSSLDTINKIYGNETSAPVQNTVTVKATSAVGCTTSKSTSFTINPLVRARFTSSADSGCTPLRVVFSDSSTVASNIRRWIVNGIPVANQVSQYVHVFTNPTLSDTIYTIKLAVRNNQGFNCVDTMVKKIKVFAKPRANDLIVDPTEGCSPLTVQFSGNVQNAVSYFWDFDDGTDTTITGQNITRTLYNSHPVSNRIHQVMRISFSDKGCRDTTIKSIVVKPQTKAVISNIQSSGCTPFTAQFSALNSVNANAFVWDFGNGSPSNASPNPNITYVNLSDTVQTFRVRLIARKLQANFCPDTAYTTITVYPAPQANFGTNTNAGCGPLPIVLTNTSSGGMISYWVLSSGGISDTLYPNAQGISDTIIDNPNFANKTIRVDQTVISSQGCIARRSQIIQIYPNLIADFEVDTAGCHPHVVKFKNLSENNLGSYFWEFGNGSSSTEKDPIQIFENYTGADVTYTVKLTSTSPIGNCIKTKTINLVVHPRPSANFRFLSDSSIQLPVNTVTIGNRTRFRNNWTYSWTFDDGTSDTNGDSTFVHTFPLGNDDFLDTNFVITMVARSPMGCTDTLRKVMVVKPGQPIAAFEATPREGCRPLEVQFTSTSSFARRYEWSYVDKEGSPPIILTERNPVVFFETAGLKTVKLKVRGLGGKDSIEKVDYINVFETPRSSFTVDPTPPRTVIAPEQPAYFIPNDSRPDFSYTWYFGDGDSSTSRTPQHKYQTPGVYDVALKVVGPNGCSSMDTVKGAVIARGEQVLVAPTAFTPNPLGSNGGMVGGDGENDVFYPFVQGMTNIRMTIYNRWGQVLFHSEELNRGWDGYYRGKLMPSDTYIFRIQANFTNGESQTFLGDVTLLR